MALARLRRSTRFVAVLLLASFWGLAHKDSDDACANALLEAHDESKHVVGAADGDAAEHCAVCHSVRTPRRPFGPAPQLHAPLGLASSADAADARFCRAPALDRIPARAPPATLT
jgi:hypothetical protein